MILVRVSNRSFIKLIRLVNIHLDLTDGVIVEPFYNLSIRNFVSINTQVYNLNHVTNREALTVLCSVLKQSNVSFHFLSALAASCMLYNRTEHSQGFFICFMVKNPLNSPCITFNFQNKLSFQSEQQCHQHALYSHKACYNKPIRIPVRMVQVI